MSCCSASPTHALQFSSCPPPPPFRLPPQFAECNKRYNEVERSLEQLADHVEQYANAVQDLVSIQSSIAGDLLFFCDRESPQRQNMEAFLNSLRDLNQRKTSRLLASLKDGFVEPIRDHLAEAGTMGKILEKRKHKKTDMDYYKQKLAQSKMKGPQDKVKAAEDKLRPAVEIYESVTSLLLKRFQQVETVAENIPHTVLPAIMTLSQSWFQGGNDLLANFLPTVTKSAEEARALLREDGTDTSYGLRELNASA